MWSSSLISFGFVEQYINKIGFRCTTWCGKMPHNVFCFSWVFVFTSDGDSKASHEFYF